LGSWLADDNANFAPCPDFHNSDFYAGRGGSLDGSPYVTLPEGIGAAAHVRRGLTASPDGFNRRQFAMLVAHRRLDDLVVLDHEPCHRF
jgi:hypothetical protein